MVRHRAAGTSTTDRVTFELHAPPQGSVLLTYVIDAGGRMELVGNEADEDPMPQNETCPP